jgi:hypothetical protein
MADAVTTQVLHKGDHNNRYVVRLTSLSDGTGESAVIKVDISTLGVTQGEAGAPSKTCTWTTVEKIEYNVSGMTVSLLWDHTTDDVIARLGSGFGCEDFKKVGGLHDPKSSGGTGDILLTTAGHTSGDTYDITLYLKLEA